MVVTEKLSCPCGLVFNDPRYLAAHATRCDGSPVTINHEADTAPVTPTPVTPTPVAPWTGSACVECGESIDPSKLDTYTEGEEAQLVCRSCDISSTPSSTPVVHATPKEPEPAERMFFSDYGKDKIREIAMVYPDPVLLMGPTGCGKSAGVRYVANQMQSNYRGINAHPAMDISQLIGMYRPANRDGNVVVEWEHGVLTEAVEKGMTFFFEEATRMSPEAAGRLFGILDTNDRYYNLMERGGADIKVHDNFWLVATANPTGNGYHTQALDPALRSRFAAIFNITEPMADEKAILADMLQGQPSEYQTKMWRFILDSRRAPESSINTRDMVLACRLINKGFTPMRAIELAILEKYPGQDEGLRQQAYNHFEAGSA